MGKVLLFVMTFSCLTVYAEITACKPLVNIVLTTEGMGIYSVLNSNVSKVPHQDGSVEFKNSDTSVLVHKDKIVRHLQHKLSDIPGAVGEMIATKTIEYDSDTCEITKITEVNRVVGGLAGDTSKDVSVDKSSCQLIYSQMKGVASLDMSPVVGFDFEKVSYCMTYFPANKQKMKPSTQDKNSKPSATK